MNSTAARKIVIIDDEPAIRRLARMILEAEHIKVSEAADGQLGLLAVAHQHPDLVLLDLGLPDMDGLKVLDRLREWSDVPVIILTVRDDPEEKIAALNSGADDYVTKPFHAGELLARIRAVAKRRLPSLADAVVQCGALRFDRIQREVSLSGERLALTPTEFRILSVLLKNRGCVLTKTAIIDNVWGGASQSVGEEHLRVHMAALRRKLRDVDPCADAMIKTEPGIGYRIQE